MNITDETTFYNSDWGTSWVYAHIGHWLNRPQSLSKLRHKVSNDIIQAMCLVENINISSHGTVMYLPLGVVRLFIWASVH